MTTGTVGAEGASGGWMAALSRILSGAGDTMRENPDMFRMLGLAAGKGLAGDNPLLNNMADLGLGMQKMKSYKDSSAKFLDMLTGLPEGGKFSFDPKGGAKLTLSNMKDMTSILEGDPLDANTPLGSLTGTSGSTPAVSTEGAGKSTLNPPSAGETQPKEKTGLRSFSLNDLAGMTPEDFNSAMTMASKFDTLMNPKSTHFPVPIPGIGYVTEEVWKSMPDKEKNYALYVDMARKMGDEGIMDRVAFDQMDPTEQGKFIEELIDSPEKKKMYEWMKGVEADSDMKSIARLIQESKVKSDMVAYDDISSPEYIDKINKQLDSQLLTNIDRYEKDPNARGRDALKSYVNGLRGAGMTVQPSRKDIKDTDKVVELIVTSSETGLSKTIKFPLEQFKYNKE